MPDYSDSEKIRPKDRLSLLRGRHERAPRENVRRKRLYR